MQADIYTHTRTFSLLKRLYQEFSIVNRDPILPLWEQPIACFFLRIKEEMLQWVQRQRNTRLKGWCISEWKGVVEADRGNVRGALEDSCSGGRGQIEDCAL